MSDTRVHSVFRPVCVNVTKKEKYRLLAFQHLRRAYIKELWALWNSGTPLESRGAEPECRSTSFVFCWRTVETKRSETCGTTLAKQLSSSGASRLGY